MSYKVVSSLFPKAKALLDMIQQKDDSGVHKYQFVRMIFHDPLGRPCHTLYPIDQISSEKDVLIGKQIDGSSHPLCTSGTAADVTILADYIGSNSSVHSVFDDPFQPGVLCVMASMVDSKKLEPQPFETRAVLIRAKEYLKSVLGDKATAFFGPEAEFFLFDQVDVDIHGTGASYELHSDQRASKDGEVVRFPRPLNGAYRMAGPGDKGHDEIRMHIIKRLKEAGFTVEMGHAEVAQSQSEIGIQLADPDTAGDRQLLFRWIVKMAAAEKGKIATFMPKPKADENGSGMHVHFSIWNDDQNLFAGENKNLSDFARKAIAGLIKYSRNMAAFTNPTVNSYKRIVPDKEAPTRAAWSEVGGNRTTAFRTPDVSDESPKARRVEFRAPDPTSNPYLAFAAMLMAAIAGVQENLPAPVPMNGVNLYDSHFEGLNSNVLTSQAALIAILGSNPQDIEQISAVLVFTSQMLSAGNLKQFEEAVAGYTSASKALGEKEGGISTELAAKLKGLDEQVKVLDYAKHIKQLPGSLEEALNELERDHSFLTKGGVFGEQFISDYIAYKRKEIAEVVTSSITPAEIARYLVSY